MRYFIFLTFFFLTVAPSLGEDIEECIFDQASQIEKIKTFHSKHQGSVLDIDKREVIVKTTDGKVHYTRGGCVHLGVTIEFQPNDKENYNNETELFNKVEELLREYGGELFTAQEFSKKIDNGDFGKIGDDIMYYVLKQNTLTHFEFSYVVHDGVRKIIVFYYI